MTYYFAKTLTGAFDDTVRRTTEALKREGFGIITEIDVKETLKEKINADFRNYRILAACKSDPCSRGVADRGQGRDHVALQRGGTGPWRWPK